MTKEEIARRAARAVDCHQKGYNCAQAVACAFADQTDLEEKTIFRMAEGLGLGMGGMRGTCGAISAAALLCGLKHSTAHLEAPDSKAVSYEYAQACLARFEERYGTLRCQELRGGDGEEPLEVIRRRCDGYIAAAVEIAADVLYGGE